ncbi:MAG: hypothetical protein L6V85_00820 [Clostridiales bacterium]|nr:MAG: hypothetical protein L6V85_00820 [Clostridiales bacterium]
MSFNAENGERNLGTLSLSDNIDCVIAKKRQNLVFRHDGKRQIPLFQPVIRL